MKDIPIIMSAPMVLATLREIEHPGTGKTETRRLLYTKRKAKSGIVPASATFLQNYPPPCEPIRPGETWPHDIAPDEYWTLTGWYKVKPGDRLWVRESLVCADDRCWKYAADETFVQLEQGDPRVADMIAWAHHYDHPKAPSIHMPRWASRLTLVVGATKIERLQEITEASAIAEGSRIALADLPPAARKAAWSERQAFSHIWDALHGAGAWDANPFVVPITFKPHIVNIDRMQAEAA